MLKAWVSLLRLLGSQSKREGFMNTLRMVMYGIVAANFVLVSMIGTIADGMEILTATEVTHDQTGGTRSGKEIN